MLGRLGGRQCRIRFLPCGARAGYGHRPGRMRPRRGVACL